MKSRFELNNFKERLEKLGPVLASMLSEMGTVVINNLYSKKWEIKAGLQILLVKKQ